MEFPGPRGFPRDFPEDLTQAMLVGTILVGRLGVDGADGAAPGRSSGSGLDQKKS